MTKNEMELEFYIVLDNITHQKLLLKFFPAVSVHCMLLKFFLDKNGFRQHKHLFETFF